MDDPFGQSSLHDIFQQGTMISTYLQIVHLTFVLFGGYGPLGQLASYFLIRFRNTTSLFKVQMSHKRKKDKPETFFSVFIRGNSSVMHKYI